MLLSQTHGDSLSPCKPLSHGKGAHLLGASAAPHTGRPAMALWRRKSGLLGGTDIFFGSFLHKIELRLLEKWFQLFLRALLPGPPPTGRNPGAEHEQPAPLQPRAPTELSASGASLLAWSWPPQGPRLVFLPGDCPGRRSTSHRKAQERFTLIRHRPHATRCPHPGKRPLPGHARSLPGAGAVLAGQRAQGRRAGGASPAVRGAQSCDPPALPPSEACSPR